MQFLRRIVAAVVLALWLPATLHCDLEAAGVGDLFKCTANHHDPSATPADQDGCDVVEDGAFRPASDTATLPPPILAAIPVYFLFPPHELPLRPPDRGLTEVASAPDEIARTWHFVAHAAPPPRAPSLAS